MKPLNAEEIAKLTAHHHRCNGKTCTCRCNRSFIPEEIMIIGPDPRAGVPCAHYDGELMPFNGAKSIEWYSQNDPQSLADSVTPPQKEAKR